MDYLAFEQPIADLEAEIQRLETENDESLAAAEKIRTLRRELTDLTREIYGDLTPWQTVQVARHKDRPHTTDYLSLVFDEFIELHGDKLFGDERVQRMAMLDERFDKRVRRRRRAAVQSFAVFGHGGPA